MSESLFKKLIFEIIPKNGMATKHEQIECILDEAKKEFPIHFKMDTISGGEYDKETDSFTPQIVTTEILENLSLKQYQANAFFNKDEVLNWFKKWFGV